MTTLQEAARDALEALERIGKDFVCRSAHHAKKDQHSAFAECPVVVRHTDAIESLKAALAQQVEQPVCYDCGIPAGDVHMSTCKSGKWPSRVSNGDTAAPAPQAQQPVAFFPPLPRSVLRCAQTVVYDAMQMRQYAMRFTELLAAAPAPQAQPDWLLKTTQDLANSIRRRCFPEVPQFQVLDDLAGVISQIDNMTCGMERKSAPQAQEPCPNGSKCKHGAWCTEVYCQELCEFRNQPAPQPAQGAVTRRKIFVCAHCDGIYADQTVTQCDCMEGTGADFVEGFAEYPAALQSAQSNQVLEKFDELRSAHGIREVK